MEFFFKPRGIAVVGATPGQGKGGHVIINNLNRGYTGKIYPVNPRYEKIEGFPCYSSILDVPDPVDLAIVFISAQLVPAVIDACVRRKIPGVMIQSAGFSETGDQGKAIQDEVKRIADRSAIRLWGPNCMGLVDAPSRFIFSTVTPTIWDTQLVPGGVSLIVQSGMLSGAFLVDILSHGTMGVNKVCSIGNKMDVNENDLIEYLIQDSATKAIGLYLETFADGRRFIDLCRRSPKPIVVLNGGKTAKGAQAAMSHTASLSGNGAVIAGALAQVGAFEARAFYQLMDFCRTLSMYPKISPESRNRIAILTYSGGAGIVQTDIMDGYGLVPAELSGPTIETLRSVFPEWMPPSNPVDLWPGAILNGPRKAFGTAMQAVAADPNVDAVFVHCFVGGFELEPDLPYLSEVARQADKPLICWISGEREQVTSFQHEAEQLSVPVFRELLRGVECLSILLSPDGSKAAIDPKLSIPSVAIKVSDALSITLESENGDLNEYISKQILSEAGIPVVEEQLVSTLEETKAAALHFGFPVVVKGLMKAASHKTEFGLVNLGIDSPAGIEVSFDRLQAAMNGKGKVLVQRQVKGKIEMMAGFVRDPQFGSCIMCGVGGILAEAINDTVFGVAPITFSEALAMISRLKSQKLLNGFRGFAPVDREAFARILVRLSELGHGHPRIQEIDINPLVINNGLPVAVDGLVVLAD
jgi:acetyltransferase